MSVFTTPVSKGSVSSFPVNLSHVIYFSRGNRIVEKNDGGKMTKTSYDTIEFVFSNNKAIYWYFDNETAREQEYARLLTL